MAFHAAVRLSSELSKGAPRPLAYTGGARRVALGEAAANGKNDAAGVAAAALKLALTEVSRLAATTPAGAALLSSALRPSYIQAPPVPSPDMPEELAEALTLQLAAAVASSSSEDAALMASYGYGSSPVADRRLSSSAASLGPSPPSPTVFSFVVPASTSGGGTVLDALSGLNNHPTAPKSSPPCAPRVGLLHLPAAATASGATGGAWLPEVAWIECAPHASPPSPASPAPLAFDGGRVYYLCMAEGEGVLVDGATGSAIYAGHWRAGLRHGTGRATIVPTPHPAAEVPLPGAVAAPHALSPSSLGGGSSFDGDWRLGVRHGRGVLTEGPALSDVAHGAPHGGGLLVGRFDATLVASGSGGGGRYDGGWAFDLKHGSGVESLAGGGTYRGAWHTGAYHGCGVFTWPTPSAVGLGLGLSSLLASAAGGAASSAASRSEYRQYVHGSLVGTRPLVGWAGAPSTAALVAPSPPAGSHGGPLAPVHGPTGSMLHLGTGLGAATGEGRLSDHAHAVSSGGSGGALDGVTALPSSGSAGSTGSVVVLGVEVGGGEASAHGLPVSGGEEHGVGLGLQLDPGHRQGQAAAFEPGGVAAALLPGVWAAAPSMPGVLPGLAPPLPVHGGMPHPHPLPMLTHQPSLSQLHGHGTVAQVPQPLNAAVLRLLKHSTVNDVGGGKVRSTGDVLTVETADTVEQALTQMTNKNVLSVPVFDAAKNKFVAVLHIMDICAFMLDLVAKKKASLSPSAVLPTAAIVTERLNAAAAAAAAASGSGPASSPSREAGGGSTSPSGGHRGVQPGSPPHGSPHTSPSLGPLSLGGHGPTGGLREALAHQRRFATAPVSEVLAMRDHLTSTAFKPLPSGAPLLFAAQSLAERGMHGVPIVDPLSGRLVRMLTQADVIRYVAGHLDELGPLGTMSVGDLGLVEAPVGGPSVSGTSESSHHLVVARFSDRAFDILQAMRAHGAPAAPVVNTYGAIVANISFSDVKAVARRANFGALQMPIAQFLSALDKPPETINPSIYVKATTQLQSLVLTIAATKIHQLYCIDDALRPLGCVRISDILSVLTKEEE